MFCKSHKSSGAAVLESALTSNLKPIQALNVASEYYSVQ